MGVSAVKSVAKIASDHDKPDGLTVVCPGAEAAFISGAWTAEAIVPGVLREEARAG